MSIALLVPNCCGSIEHRWPRAAFIQIAVLHCNRTLAVASSIFAMIGCRQLPLEYVSYFEEEGD